MANRKWRDSLANGVTSLQIGLLNDAVAYKQHPIRCKPSSGSMPVPVSEDLWWQIVWHSIYKEANPDKTVESLYVIPFCLSKSS